ncbi:MAG: hypothetical protein R3308_04460, partial [Thiohalobacterales bacterium]|nr:hypothetical protein [Thiohalobacterales bacterium]
MISSSLRLFAALSIFFTANLSHALPPGGLPENARVELGGTLEVFIREDLQRGTAAHEFFLVDGPDAPPIRLLFDNGLPTDLRSGIGITVRGTV